MKKMISNGALIIGLATLVGCGGGGGGGSSTYGLYNSPYITATGFVNALNSVDNASILNESEVILYTDETIRSAIPGEDDWFVIYDAKYDENKAVSLQYIRALTYYDYYANNYSTADEFRSREFTDISLGDVNGDFWGDDYEVVDYNVFTGTFWGRNSGFEYEDEEETKDVSLLAKDSEDKKFIQKAANVSFAFSVNIDTAMSLVSLGQKVEKMVSKGRSQEELTAEDQAVLMNDIEKLTGASLNELTEAATSSQKKSELVSKIAAKIGTSASNLESKILPELFGIE